MNRNKYLLLLYKLVGVFEIVISILLILGILVAIPDIFRYYAHILVSSEVTSYQLFQGFLSHVLLLVIAVEFVVLMVAHSDVNIIHLIMLVIARKMLVYSDTMLDLLTAVFAIAILFAIRKFLLGGNSGDVSFFEETNIYSATTPIDLLNKKYGFRIVPEDAKTIGGLVYRLVNESGSSFQSGEIVDDGKYMYQIEKVSNGLIETISIKPLEKNPENELKNDSL